MSTYDGYIERLARKVDARLQDIESIFNFDLGDEFEVAICALLEDILPAKYGVCRGFVVSKNGDKAGDDLIIYDKMSSPTLRSGMSRKFPVKEQIPVDAVYAYIECKHSITDAAVLEKAITQAQAVKKLMLTRRGLSNPNMNQTGRLTMGGSEIGPVPSPRSRTNPSAQFLHAIIHLKLLFTTPEESTLQTYSF